MSTTQQTEPFNQLIPFIGWKGPLWEFHVLAQYLEEELEKLEEAVFDSFHY